jgi:alginate O-acetyltransferase complex protein AlgI
MYINLMLTMLLGGLWHGASWTFVAWGALHGVALALHKAWTEMRARFGWTAKGGIVASAGSWLATYAFVCVCWVFFRSPDFSTAMLVLRKLGGLAPGGVAWTYLPLFIFLPIIAFAHVMGVRDGDGEVPSSGAHTAAPAYAVARRPAFVYAFVFTAWLLLLYLFVPMHHSPFIYFQF